MSDNENICYSKIDDSIINLGEEFEKGLLNEKVLVGESKLSKAKSRQSVFKKKLDEVYTLGKVNEYIYLI
jgi:hypothetical protein